MATITLTFEDFHQDGREAVSCAMKINPAKGDETAPATDAMIVAIAVKRLWDNQSILRLSGLVCTDVIQARNMVRQQQQAAEQTPAAAKTAEDVLAPPAPA